MLTLRYRNSGMFDFPGGVIAASDAKNLSCGSSDLWGSKTPITFVTCGFGRAGRQSDRVNRLA
jgi:hypothetical protein